jgi:arabinan endo-1,5-alpha-L-arabinosidase
MKRIAIILTTLALAAALVGCYSIAEKNQAAAPAASAAASAAGGGAGSAAKIDMKGPKADFDLKAIAIYTMEKADEDGNVIDGAGNDMAAFIGGDFEQVDGVFGKAMSFNGGDSYLILPNEVLDGGAWTFAAWVNPAAWPDWARIFDMGDGSSSDAWLGFAGVEKKMRFDLFGAQALTLLGDTLPLNQWSHIAVTLDGKTACMYINGELTMKKDFAMLPKEVIHKTSYIGRSNWSADPLFKGAMDDIIIADAAYTQDQVKAIARGIPVKK